MSGFSGLITYCTMALATPLTPRIPLFSLQANACSKL